MRNINLLPVKPRIDRIFVPILAVIGAFAISAVLIIVLLANQYQTESAQYQEKIAANRNLTEQLRVQKQLQPATKEYQQLQEEASLIFNSRHDWLPDFRLLEQSLPEYGVYVLIQTNDSGKLSIDMKLANLQELALYMLRLKQSPLVDDVIVMSMDRRLMGDLFANGSAESEFPNEIDWDSLLGNEENVMLTEEDQAMSRMNESFLRQLHLLSEDGVSDADPFANYANLPFTQLEIEQAKNRLSQLMAFNSTASQPLLEPDLFDIRIEIQLNVTEQGDE